MRDWLSGRTYAETAARANTVDAIRAQIDRLARAEIERLENLKNLKDEEVETLEMLREMLSLALSIEQGDANDLIAALIDGNSKPIDAATGQQFVKLMRAKPGRSPNPVSPASPVTPSLPRCLARVAFLSCRRPGRWWRCRSDRPKLSIGRWRRGGSNERLGFVV